MNNYLQNSTNKELTDKQLESIPVIIAAKNYSQGIEQANISRSTFYSWLKTPEYKKELDFQKAQLIKQALSNLKTSTGKAVQVLIRLLDSDNEMIRLKTAITILEFTEKFQEQEEIIEKLNKLERKL
jgi:hypothetical protein